MLQERVGSNAASGKLSPACGCMGLKMVKKPSGTYCTRMSAQCFACMSRSCM